MSFKIAIIGAGSVGFTKKLFTDLLCVPEFRDIEVALTDISQHNLDMIRAILDKIVEANGFPVKVTADTDRRRALEVGTDEQRLPTLGLEPRGELRRPARRPPGVSFSPGFRQVQATPVSLLNYMLLAQSHCHNQHR